MVHRPPPPSPARTPFSAAALPAALRLAAVYALFTAVVLAMPVPAAAAEWALYGGVFDLAGDEEAAELGVEARFRLFDVPLGSFDLPVEPAAGVMGTSDGGGYLYFSLRLPLHELWGDGRGDDEPPRWRLVPFTGGGLYAAGDGKDLGGPVEFRSGLEISVRAGERWWIGLSYDHLSNAVLYDHNPGEESLVLVVSKR